MQNLFKSDIAAAESSLVLALYFDQLCFVDGPFREARLFVLTLFCWFFSAVFLVISIDSDVRNNAVEELGNSFVGFGGGLAVTHVVVISFGLGLFLRYFSVILVIKFVPHEDHDGAVIFEVGEEFDPGVDHLEAEFIWQVKDKNSAVCVSDVGRDETSKFLLTSCIPELQFIDKPLEDNIFHDEINANCFLHMCLSTLRD